MDGMANVSLKPSVLDQPFLSLDELAAGMTVQGEVVARITSSTTHSSIIPRSKSRLLLTLSSASVVVSQKVASHRQ